METIFAQKVPEFNFSLDGVQKSPFVGNLSVDRCQRGWGCRMLVAWSPVSARRYYFTLLTLIAAVGIIFYQYILNSGPDYSLYYSLLKNVVNGVSFL